MNIDDLNYKNNLIPVITQDIEGKVLMMAYANKEAIEKTLETKHAWYWSRKRKKLWMKGEESGNIQKIIGVYTDCDKDTLLYTVKQIKNACHKGSYSCFMVPLFGKKGMQVLEEVYKVIRDRKKLDPKNSYVAGIINNDKKLIAKIREESEELIEAFTENDNITWEAADLIFHTLLLLANRDVKWEELVEEFRRRRK
ncbi:MAG: bifunctional phosphoribosyl-AMP cyclohydrolase/phosphoribosyl-ATP diphosphatase HisIE [Thermoplasmatales archaeon]|nr:MAG: bifunctional phosphoribosyl-AMP cyclohydrolase/phosphoribosyl-ATP diphosphatase HisIE [Thermoplasmatales archaeon]